MPKVFIIFDYSDIVSKKVVENWKNQNMGADISFTSEDGDSHSSKGDDFVKKCSVSKLMLLKKFWF